MKFRIKEVMKENGFNNVKLANAIGVTRSTITNNLKNPSIETLEKIAGVFGVRVSDLLDEEQNELDPIYKKDDSGKEIIVGYLKK